LTKHEDRLAGVFVQKDEIVSRNIAGETILVPIRGNLADMQNIFTLNKVGAFIWEQLDGKRPLSEIHVSLCDCFEVSSEEAERDILEFVDHVNETGLVLEKS
jgi:hypothetical protein